MTIKQDNTIMTIEPLTNILLVSRLIDNRQYKFVVDLDGTVGDLALKVSRIKLLSDQLFVTFGLLQAGD